MPPNLPHHNAVFDQPLSPLARREVEAKAKGHYVGQKLRSASRWE